MILLVCIAIAVLVFVGSDADGRKQKDQISEQTSQMKSSNDSSNEGLFRVLNDTNFDVYKSSIFFSSFRWPYLSPIGPSGYFVCRCPNRSAQVVRPVTTQPQTTPTTQTTPTPTPSTPTPEPPTDSPPTTLPTDGPTDSTPPTEAPTEPQTDAPTEPPTDAPTEAPTDAQTEADSPTDAQTEAPTDAPTEAQSEAPTNAPADSDVQTSTAAQQQAITRRTRTPAAAPTHRLKTKIPIIVKTFVNKVLDTSQLKIKGNRSNHSMKKFGNYMSELDGDVLDNIENSDDHLDDNQVTSVTMSSVTTNNHIQTSTQLAQNKKNISNRFGDSDDDQEVQRLNDSSKFIERNNPIDDWNERILERRQRIERLGEKYRRIKKRRKLRRQ